MRNTTHTKNPCNYIRKISYSRTYRESTQNIQPAHIYRIYAKYFTRAHTGNICDYICKISYLRTYREFTQNLIRIYTINLCNYIHKISYLRTYREFPQNTSPVHTPRIFATTSAEYPIRVHTEIIRKIFYSRTHT